ncbi:MAG TPA: Flp pilus assembly protein CpaB [Longimicrobiales bacterium]
MMRNRSLMVLGLALMSATVAGFAAVRYTKQRPMQLPGERESAAAQIVVAARDLPVGHFVTDGDVRLVSWPGEAVPAGYVTQPAAVVGRGLIAAVRTNAPILEPDLAEKGSGAGLPIIFPEGMRAVSVRVDDVIAVAGYVTPRTRVDVMLTIKPPAGGGQTYTQTILQNLTVLAAGQAVERNEKGEPMTVSVVTLMVTPEQGEKLVLAASQGRIQLALRNMVDTEDVETAGIGEARLLELGRQPVRTASGTVRPRAGTPQSDGIVIETYKGGQKSLTRF